MIICKVGLFSPYFSNVFLTIVYSKSINWNICTVELLKRRQNNYLKYLLYNISQKKK